MKRLFAAMLTLSLTTALVGCAGDPATCDGVDDIGCTSLKLTGDIGKIDRVVIFLQLFAVDEQIYIQRIGESMHGEVSLPVIVPFRIPLSAPYDDALIYVSAYGILGDRDRGLVSFSMLPDPSPQKVTAPMTRVENSPCYNGIQDTGESDIDCGAPGVSDSAAPGYSGPVIALVNRCFPCLEGKSCIFNEECLSANCNSNSLSCDPPRN